MVGGLGNSAGPRLFKNISNGEHLCLNDKYQTLTLDMMCFKYLSVLFIAILKLCQRDVKTQDTNSMSNDNRFITPVVKYC